jgi:F-type H+-transporting ATPase subunit b
LTDQIWKPNRAEQSPDEKAAAIIDKVPSTSLFTKTGGVILGTGLTAAAISSELYVVTEETVLAVGFFVILAAVGRSIGGPYSAWANGHIEVRQMDAGTVCDVAAGLTL